MRASGARTPALLDYDRRGRGADAWDLGDRIASLTAKRGGDAAAFAADPPSGWVVGTLEQAAEQLTRLRDAGVSRVMCQHLLHEDLEAVALLGELAQRTR